MYVLCIVYIIVSYTMSEFVWHVQIVVTVIVLTQLCIMHDYIHLPYVVHVKTGQV